MTDLSAQIMMCLSACNVDHNTRITTRAWIQLQIRICGARSSLQLDFFPFSETLMHVSQSKQMDHNKLRLLFVQTQAYCSLPFPLIPRYKQGEFSKQISYNFWMDGSTIKPYNRAPVRHHTGTMAILTVEIPHTLRATLKA